MRSVIQGLLKNRPAWAVPARKFTALASQIDSAKMPLTSSLYKSDCKRASVRSRTNEHLSMHQISLSTPRWNLFTILFHANSSVQFSNLGGSIKSHLRNVLLASIWKYQIFEFLRSHVCLSFSQKIYSMDKYMRITDSLFGFLNGSSNTETIQVERIRVAMLNAMDAHCGDVHLALDGPLQFARDLETLWYLRPDLLHAIASSRDQRTATLVIHDITQMFKGHFALAKSSQFKQF